jgi:hypothetical protein
MASLKRKHPCDGFDALENGINFSLVDSTQHQWRDFNAAWDSNSTQDIEMVLFLDQMDNDEPMKKCIDLCPLPDFDSSTLASGIPLNRPMVVTYDPYPLPEEDTFILDELQTFERCVFGVNIEMHKEGKRGPCVASSFDEVLRRPPSRNRIKLPQKPENEERQHLKTITTWYQNSMQNSNDVCPV